MGKNFRNERHKELYKKFQALSRRYDSLTLNFRGEKPIYWKIIRNSVDLYLDKGRIKPELDDIVYKTLRESKRHALNIISCLHPSEDKIMSNEGWAKLKFIADLTSFFEDRGANKDFTKRFPDAKINASRYNLLLENLVDVSHEKKLENLRSFIYNLPSSSEERINW